jgi:Secretion system C-terminal sorting domain
MLLSAIFVYRKLSTIKSYFYTTMKPKTLFFIFIFCTYANLKAQWTELGGVNSLLTNHGMGTICSDAAGNIYVAGQFINASGKCYVPKWNGTAWVELVGLNTGTNNPLFSVCSDTVGNIYAAGDFTNTMGKYYLAKWDGSTWSELGGLNALAADDPISVVRSDKQGNLYAIGSFTDSSGNPCVIKWNGNSWTQLPGFAGTAYWKGISAICTDNAGNLYATGGFTNSTGNYYVAKWAGSAWIELAGLSALATQSVFGAVYIRYNTITTLHADANGNVYAAGSFTNAAGRIYIAKWNGNVWTELPALDVKGSGNYFYSICSDALGNIYAGGELRNSAWGNFYGKWNGSNWIDLGGAFTGNFTFISSLCTDPSGNLYAAGNITNSSGNKYVAQYKAAAQVGLAEQIGDADFLIYPNPCKEKLQVQVKENTNAGIKIYNLNGQVVLKTEFENTKAIELNVTELISGMYVLEIQTNNTKSKRVKWIKE